MLLRAGKDIVFLLGSVRSARYLLMFVLLMLWGRLILIVIEHAMSATVRTDDERVERLSSTAQISAEENHENQTMGGDIENTYVCNSESAQSITPAWTATRAHSDQLSGDDAISQFTDIDAIHKQQGPTAIRSRF